jgi:hypothetical protein
MITGIVIPHDKELPLVEEPFDDLRDYQKVVDGYVEVVHIETPKLTLYTNEEGKVFGLPINERATSMWWLLSPEMRHRDVLVGIIVIVGASYGRDSNTEIPPEFRKLLLDTPLFKVEAQTADNKTHWFVSEKEFTSYFEAAIHAIELRKEWTEVEDNRVIPA